MLVRATSEVPAFQNLSLGDVYKEFSVNFNIPATQNPIANPSILGGRQTDPTANPRRADPEIKVDLVSQATLADPVGVIFQSDETSPTMPIKPIVRSLAKYIEVGNTNNMNENSNNHNDANTKTINNSNGQNGNHRHSIIQNSQIASSPPVEDSSYIESAIQNLNELIHVEEKASKEELEKEEKINSQLVNNELIKALLETNPSTQPDLRVSVFHDNSEEEHSELNQERETEVQTGKNLSCILNILSFSSKGKIFIIFSYE